jgi:hypothetical protein
MNRLDQRLEALIASMNSLLDIMVQNRTMTAELMAWLQQPPSNELPQFLIRMAKAVEANTGQLMALRQQVNDLPAALAQAVRE